MMVVVTGWLMWCELCCWSDNLLSLAPSLHNIHQTNIYHERGGETLLPPPPPMGIFRTIYDDKNMERITNKNTVTLYNLNNKYYYPPARPICTRISHNSFNNLLKFDMIGDRVRSFSLLRYGSGKADRSETVRLKANDCCEYQFIVH